MRTHRYCTMLALTVVLLSVSTVLALDGRSIARLKKAGLSDQTIEAAVAERVVETAAFTVEDIIAMKTAGIGESVLQAILREGSFLKERQPVVYGSDQLSMRLATAADIIQLKQAGVSDEVLTAVVEVSRRGSEADRENAWRMLREAGVWVDLGRKK